METILAHAQQLVYTLLSLMPSQYQRDNLQAMLGLFLEAQGHPLPQHSKTKSASALSRFLNIYSWSTRKLIRITRDYILQQILSDCPKGRRPMLQVIIDLTKKGKIREIQTQRASNLSLQRQTWTTFGRAVFGRRLLENPLEFSCLERKRYFLTRFLRISTKQLKGSTITWWGRRRWLSCGLV